MKNQKTTKTQKTRTSPEWSDGMHAAAGILDVPLKDIQRAKNGGCLAFRNGRVCAESLSAWLDQDRLETEIAVMALRLKRLSRELGADRHAVAMELAQRLNVDADAVTAELEVLDSAFLESVNLKFLREADAAPSA